MRDKRKRLEQVILPILKCIVCRNSKLEIEGDLIVCKNCGAHYLIHEDIPIMTAVPNKAFEYNPSVIVENNYYEQWAELIESAGEGLVLDIGAGNNPDRYDNLIKLEIFALPNVDVVGFGEDLPFKDGVFQKVFSGAVIEHVEDPHRVVKSINRTLMDEGEVYIETAFLQPVHAYPDHYYNMTKQGLERLLSDFDKLDSGVKPHQYPLFTLQWILTSWKDKLEDVEKESFLNTTVQEILNEFHRNNLSKRWLSPFSQKDIEELACGVYFHGKRRVRPQVSLMEEMKMRLRKSIKCLLGRM